MGCAKSIPLDREPDERGLAIFKLMEECLLMIKPGDGANKEIHKKYKEARGAFGEGVDRSIFRGADIRLDTELKKRITQFVLSQYSSTQAAGFSVTGARLTKALNEIGEMKLVNLGKEARRTLTKEYAKTSPFFEVPPWDQDGIDAYKCPELDKFVETSLVHPVCGSFFGVMCMLACFADSAIM
jgi:hypothetical protein